MKKTLIAIFFVGLMLLVPCTGAFTLPVNKQEQKDLKQLVNYEENESIQKTLEQLISDIEHSDGNLHLSTIESILEEQIDIEGQIGDESVLDTDSWEWITNRLGWIYITTDNVVTLFNKGNYIFTVFSVKTALLTGWYQSIVLMKDTWQAFKNNPQLMSLIDFVNAVSAVASLTVTLISDLTDGEQELIDALTDFQTEVQSFSTFINDEPWKAPILVYGTVDGISNTAEVSCNENTVTTSGDYNLSVPTENSNPAWWIHRCDITASTNNKQKSQSSYAFSMGKIEADFDFSTEKSIPQHPLFLYLQQLFFGKLPLFQQLF